MELRKIDATCDDMFSIAFSHFAFESDFNLVFSRLEISIGPIRYTQTWSLTENVVCSLLIYLRYRIFFRFKMKLRFLFVIESINRQTASTINRWFSEEASKCINTHIINYIKPNWINRLKHPVIQVHRLFKFKAVLFFQFAYQGNECTDNFCCC